MLDEPDNDEPFIIEFEYSVNKKSSRMIIQECPLIEIMVSIQPF
jgi:hypothetical protein